MLEDEMLRNPKWNDQYKGHRVVFWDNTNLDIKGKPSDAEIQAKTFSSYYNGNVAKGGVFLQLCGWQGAYELWMGAVSDTDYMNRSGLLNDQQDFTKKEHEKLCTDVIPFFNILDKG
jgi:hypothetical protein